MSTMLTEASAFISAGDRRHRRAEHDREHQPDQARRQMLGDERQEDVVGVARPLPPDVAASAARVASRARRAPSRPRVRRDAAVPGGRASPASPRGEQPSAAAAPRLERARRIAARSARTVRGPPAL